MTQAEFTAWTQDTNRSRYSWRMDQIHDGREGRDALLYRGGESGLYVHIDCAGIATFGRYLGAVPHMGEAEYLPQTTRTFASTGEALTWVLERLGARALVTILDLDRGFAPLYS